MPMSSRLTASQNEARPSIASSASGRDADSGWASRKVSSEVWPAEVGRAIITKRWLGSTFSAVLGKIQAKRALVASVSERPDTGGGPFHPPCSLLSARGDVHMPVYMPAPCQGGWAFIGATLTRRGWTHGRW